MPAPLLVVCTPIGSRPTADFMSSYVDLKTQLDLANFESQRGGGAPVMHHTTAFLPGLKDIAQARNLITRNALAMGADYLLWIDDDMTFSPAAVLRLMQRRVPIVGGLCFNRHAPSYPPVLLRKHAANRNLDNSPMGFVYDFPPDSLFEVDATGGAFLLVQRKVFEQIPVTPEAQWWTPIDMPGLGSEDVSFCVRAQRAGFKIFVDTGVRIGHKAEVKIDADVAESLRGPHRVNEWVPEALAKNATTEPKRALATIVIPTYNTPSKYLHAAVMSAMEQTVPVEVIVVDDGSKEFDEIPGAADGLVKLVRHDRNKGIAEALNTGFREATTDWICWLSADDMIAPTKIERQLQAAYATGSKALFHGYATLVDDTREWQMPKPPPWFDMQSCQEALTKGCHINGSTTMIHRSVFHKVGLYDPAFRFSQDWEMWNRIAKGFLWHYVPDTLGLRRENMGNLTRKLSGDSETGKARATEDAKIRREYGEPVSLEEEAAGLR